MRRKLLATLAVALFFASTPSSHAQRDARTAPRAQGETIQPNPPRAVSFRMRTAEERLATVRRLENSRTRTSRAPAAPLALAPIAFNDTFPITARTPHVAGRGSLYALHATLDSRPDPAGEIVFPHMSTPDPSDAGRFMIQLHLPDTRRTLVECTVVGNDAPFRGYLYRYGGDELWSDHSTPYQNVISFLTPPLSDGGEPLFFGVWPTNPNPGMYGWVLLGCQVTRLSLP